MKLKEEIEDIYDIYKEAGLKNKIKVEKKNKKNKMKPGDLKKKIYAYISGQTGIEKRIKDHQGHIMETSNRALNKILNKVI